MDSTDGVADVGDGEGCAGDDRSDDWDDWGAGCTLLRRFLCSTSR